MDSISSSRAQALPTDNNVIATAAVPNPRAIRSAAPSERFVVTVAIVMRIQIALATSTVQRDIAASVAAPTGSRSLGRASSRRAAAGVRASGSPNDRVSEPERVAAVNRRASR